MRAQVVSFGTLTNSVFSNISSPSHQFKYTLDRTDVLVSLVAIMWKPQYMLFLLVSLLVS